jgi:hypothetical protein
MLQGFEGLAPIGRHLSVVGVTAALGVVGWLSLARWKDARTARICLMLVLAMLPVQASQLGAMLYSMLHGVGASGSQHVPEMLRMASVGREGWLAAAAATAAGMAPFLYAGFAMLARPRALGLVVAFLAASAVLVLPLRDAPFTLVAAASLGALAERLGSVLRSDLGGDRARDAALVEQLFLVPALIVAGRGMLYTEPTLAFAALCALAGRHLFFVVPRVDARPVTTELAQLGGAIAFTVAWLVAAARLIDAGIGSPALRVAVAILPGVVLLLQLARWVRVNPGFYRAVAAAVAGLGVMTTVSLGESLAGGLVALGFGLTLVAAGQAYGAIAVRMAGVVGAGAGVLVLGARLVAATDVSYWVIAAGAGLVCFVAAALQERSSRRRRAGG